MLIDEATITISGGHGGAGKISFGRRMHSGPDGGNGGIGGHVYIVPTQDIFALNQFSQKKVVRAENGMPGGSNKRSGRNGADTYIKLPIGSLIINLNTDEQISLDSMDAPIRICRGGKGGLGNFEFRSAVNTTPRIAQPGLRGETKHLKILLKLIATFGLIGLPNAGKSSLLNELTNAKARVGNYPFTTLSANLGDFEGRIVADIPGLIEGASEGKGLGTKFLKHIEKVSLLLHCISVDSDDVVRDYMVVTNELKKFNPELLEKDRVLLLTKTDTVDSKQVTKQRMKLKKYAHDILPVSILDETQFGHLTQLLRDRG